MRRLALCVACGAAALLLATGPSVAGAQVAHEVEQGESLWSIAAVNGIGVEELAAANGLSPDSLLTTGSTVQIPTVTPAPGAAPPTGTGECVWDCQSTVHPHPTDEAVTPEQAASIAAEQGMSGELVQAIASEESGFSNALVSSAGARGVMQIIPDTWELVQSQLAAAPLSPVSAIDNVRAGVTYLHHLYHVKGGDPEETIASYFQGPNREGWSRRRTTTCARCSGRRRRSGEAEPKAQVAEPISITTG